MPVCRGKDDEVTVCGFELRDVIAVFSGGENAQRLRSLHTVPDKKNITPFGMRLSIP
jgi:hypothetical protein